MHAIILVGFLSGCNSQISDYVSSVAREPNPSEAGEATTSAQTGLGVKISPGSAQVVGTSTGMRLQITNSIQPLTGTSASAQVGFSKNSQTR